ncbi:MAG: DUF411 domain-containing protein [Mariprofundaceae bacterium]
MKKVYVLSVGIVLSLFSGLFSANAAEMVVYKSPQCSCCNAWITHLRHEGFTVKSEERSDMDAIKAKHGVTDKLASCHTAMIGGYIIEGHVPASDIKRLLEEKPDIVGLTAPGMPMKSPGMQPEGRAPQGYDVLSYDQKGDTQIFKHYK